MTMAAWTYEGYWNVVLGDKRDARQVVAEFGLDPSDRRGLDEWLGVAESTAWAESGESLEAFPRGEWSPFHAQALDGRPRSQEPSPAALAKRRSRERKTPPPDAPTK